MKETRPTTSLRLAPVYMLHSGTRHSMGHPRARPPRAAICGGGGAPHGRLAPQQCCTKPHPPAPTHALPSDSTECLSPMMHARAHRLRREKSSDRSASASGKGASSTGKWIATMVLCDPAEPRMFTDMQRPRPIFTIHAIGVDPSPGQCRHICVPCTVGAAPSAIASSEDRFHVGAGLCQQRQPSRQRLKRPQPPAGVEVRHPEGNPTAASSRFSKRRGQVAVLPIVPRDTGWSPDHGSPCDEGDSLLSDEHPGLCGMCLKTT